METATGIALSSLVQKLQPSATIAAAAKAKELKSKGVQVREFTLGEPDFLTPEHIREAAKVAMDAGHTHYTPATGIPALKEAICQRFEEDHGVKYAANEIAVSNGAKHSIHNVLTAICNPGDEVLIPAPYWVSYSALVELTGATATLLPTQQDDGFCMRPEDFEAAITDRTKLVMINNPCNPTGGVYPVEWLEQIAKIAVAKGIVILSDEIYEKLIYDGFEFRSFATFGDDVRAQTVVVSGVSKAYAMTGWRIGWTMAPAALTAGFTKLQSQQTSNPCSVSQHAAIAALTGPQDCVEEMRLKFAERRKYVLSRLAEMPGVSMAEPGGAFYAFFNVSEHFNRQLKCGVTVENSSDFCTALLENAHVGLVTGDAFGSPGYVRLSFATDMETIEAGLNQLADFLS
ncbi:MAG: pyridoxal phosphate-dependent aminotransferase [Planctomycetaceae bacterium]